MDKVIYYQPFRIDSILHKAGVGTFSLIADLSTLIQIACYFFCSSSRRLIVTQVGSSVITTKRCALLIVFVKYFR